MGIGLKELIIVLVIVLLVFGTKRLANIGSDLGGAIKGFKKSMKDEDAKPETLDQKKPDSDNQA
jgi:sec-independent protein translocase protein TatA